MTNILTIAITLKHFVSLNFKTDHCSLLLSMCLCREWLYWKLFLKDHCKSMSGMLLFLLKCFQFCLSCAWHRLRLSRVIWNYLNCLYSCFFYRIRGLSSQEASGHWSQFNASVMKVESGWFLLTSMVRCICPINFVHLSICWMPWATKG